MGMGVQTAVGGDDAVAVEVIVGGGILAVVATVGEDGATGDGALVAHTLVHKVPDVAALILRILAHQVPVLLEATHRVTHSVGILTLDERTGIVTLRVPLATAIVVIHRAEDVGLAVLSGLLELAGTRWVGGLHPVVRLLEVRTVTGLVAERPDDDAGVVLERQHIAMLAFQVCQLEVSALSQGTVAVAHAVALDVGLGCKVDAVLVAEVIPARVVGIVAGAHGVDVQLLHDLDVLNHTLHGDDIAAVGIQLVAVGTLDENGLTVDQQLATLDFHLADADALANRLQQLIAIPE